MPATVPRFDGLTFFAGQTLGTGSLKKILSSKERTVVHGTGQVDHGTLVLEQTVQEATSQKLAAPGGSARTHPATTSARSQMPQPPSRGRSMATGFISPLR
jgi:hypothetical protein